jgi:integrase
MPRAEALRGSVRRRNSSWSVVLDIGIDPATGKRQQTRKAFPTRKAAEAWLAASLKDAQQEAFQAPSSQTLGSFLAEWLETIRPTIRPSTWASYEQKLRTHVVPRIGALPLRAVDPTRLNRLYSELIDGGKQNGDGRLAPKTVRHVHTTLQRALRDAVRWGKLPRNPAEMADPPRGRSSAMQVWRPEQVASFLGQTKQNRLHACWFLAATTGMRRGELLGLRWSDVDLNNRRLAVTQAVIAVGYEVLVSEPKTSKSRRSIALDPATVVLLGEHRDRQGHERLAAGELWQETGLVFTRQDGSVLHPHTLSYWFDKHSREAGLPSIRLHDVRHSYASAALSAGVHPKVVSERLGHSNIGITLDTYSHVLEGMQQDAADQVADLILGGFEPAEAATNPVTMLPHDDHGLERSVGPGGHDGHEPDLP